MKKMTFFMGMISFMAIITSCEQDTPTDNNVLAKSGFDAETTYWDILSDPENGMQQFDELTNDRKAAVWTFKYERFKNDNNLTLDHIAAVDLAIDMVQNISFDEGNQTVEEQVETEIRNNFDHQTSDFLLLTLENSANDVATEGCFWCREEIPGTAGNCYAVLNTDGHPTGEFQYEASFRVRRFWIGLRTVERSFPCSADDWDAGGRQLGK